VRGGRRPALIISEGEKKDPDAEYRMNGKSETHSEPKRKGRAVHTRTVRCSRTGMAIAGRRKKGTSCTCWRSNGEKRGEGRDWAFQQGEKTCAEKRREEFRDVFWKKKEDRETYILGRRNLCERRIRAFGVREERKNIMYACIGS